MTVRVEVEGEILDAVYLGYSEEFGDHEVYITEPGWDESQVYGVSDDMLCPRCECGNPFGLCHPEA